MGAVLDGQSSAQATILVFIALPEEHDRFLEFFPAKETHLDSAYVFVEHESADTKVKLVSVLAAGMGVDNAFDATSAGVARFKPDMVVCVGIAGSLTTDLKLGDVSVSSEVIDISQNMKISEVATSRKSRPNKRGKPKAKSPTKTIVELSPKPFLIAPELAASFRFLRSHPTLKVDLAAWSSEAAERRDHLLGSSAKELGSELEHVPAAEIGPIISGPVVASSAFKDTLKRIDRKVLSVETESSGVFRAAAFGNVPSITVRGISDCSAVAMLRSALLPLRGCRRSRR